VSPALGTLWAHSVNVRVALERQAGRRYMKVGGFGGAIIECTCMNLDTVLAQQDTYIQK
jgi:hypothetical protein